LIEALGTETVIHGQVPGLPGTSSEADVRAIAILPGQSRVALNETLRLTFAQSQVHRFDAQGRRLPDLA
jgi:hypothetical protein